MPREYGKSEMPHLPKNYRVVKNGNGEYWVQKKFLWFWFDWRYRVVLDHLDPYTYCPIFKSKEEACVEAKRYLDALRDDIEKARRKKTITVVGRC